MKWKYITAARIINWKFKFILGIYLSFRLDTISPVLFSSFIYEYNINKPIVILKNVLKEGTVWKLPCGLHFLAAPSYLFHHDFFFTQLIQCEILKQFIARTSCQNQQNKWVKTKVDRFLSSSKWIWSKNIDYMRSFMIKRLFCDALKIFLRIKKYNLKC